MLRLEGIESTRGAFRLRIDRWQADAGQFHALLGRNGAGKSTLLKLIAGELPSRGRLRLHERELHDWDAGMRARHMAILPQSSQLSFAFSAEEVVALGATPLALGWREQRREIRRVMQLADCWNLAARAYPRLSGGEKQRVHFARVLLQLSQAELPPLLLLDEPTSAQDLGKQHALLKTVRSLSHESGFAVLAVLHDLNQALRYADRCSLLDGGRVLEQGRPAEVLSPARVRAVWDYEAQYAECEGGRRHIV